MNICTERLCFHPYQDTDFPFLMSLLSDPEVVRFIGNGKTRDSQGGRDFLDWIYCTYESGEGMGLMLLRNKEDATPIGHAGLVPQTIDGKKEIEIGYWIARQHWGKGYATEAAKALFAYGKRQLGFQRFIALIQPGNAASQRVAKKLGMEMEKHIVLNGQDVCVYATLSDVSGQ